MTTQYPWSFEPCENEGPIRDTRGQPWQHACRGRKPQRPSVIGYGHTERAAEDAARQNAQAQDAHEMIGERGEVTVTIVNDADLEAMRREISEWFRLPHDWKSFI